MKEDPDFEKYCTEWVDYYQKKIDNEIKELCSIVDKYTNHRDQFKEDLKNELTESIRKFSEKIETSKDCEARYISIRDAILNWNCSNEFIKVKNCALRDICICLPSVVEDIKMYKELVDTKTKQLNNIDDYVSEYYTNKVRTINDTIFNYSNKIEREKDSFKKETEFYNKFIEEIKFL